MSLSNVTVNKQQLIEKIIANREKHARDYLEAHTAWSALVRNALIEYADELKYGAVGVGSKVAKFLRENDEPESHAEDYAAALEMLAMSTQEEITLQSQAFRELVRDEWGWKRHTMETYSKYR